jgi:hypothetical protein
VRWRPILLAVTSLTLAALTAFALVVYGAYDCYESCRDELSNPPWRYDRSAWQWDAMFWLDLCSGIASIAFVATVFSDARLASAIALGAALAAMTAGGLLLRAAGDVDAVAVALVVLVLAVTGWALIVARRGRASQSRSH